MTDDAAHIHGIIDALANDGKDVLVVMHSYGGIPGTQAVKNVTRKERKEQGKKGGVMGMVYVSSLLISEGESSEDSFAAFRGEPPDFFRVSVRLSFSGRSSRLHMSMADSIRANTSISTPSKPPP